MSVKLFFIVSVLLLTLLTSACTSFHPPYQTLYEARTAIDAAEQKIGPCPCERLSPAQEAYAQAKSYHEKRQYEHAKIAATQALVYAQRILRQTP